MNRKIIQRDIAGNKAVSFLTVLFITAAAMLLSLAGILVTNLFGSIDRLMTDAKTPHLCRCIQEMWILKSWKHLLRETAQ